MSRRVFVADIQENGRTLAMAEAPTWNGAIRKSEGLVREHARAAGVMFDGEAPEVWGQPGAAGSTYRRWWRNGAQGIRAEVAEVSS